MNVGIEQLVTNIGMNFADVILLLLVVGSIIFMAAKFEMGLIILLITTGANFVISYSNGYDYVKALVVFFISLVMLSITLLAQRERSGVAIS